MKVGAKSFLDWASRLIQYAGYLARQIVGSAARTESNLDHWTILFLDTGDTLLPVSITFGSLHRLEYIPVLSESFL